MNLVLPMAGSGSRFFTSGYEKPKPLIELQGKPFFFWAAQSILKFSKINKLIFIVLKEHVEKFNVDVVILNEYPNAEIIVIQEVLNGPVLTCLESVKVINNNEPVVFNDIDHLFYSDKLVQAIYNDELSQIDGGFLTFFSQNPAYSYCEIDKSGFVSKTKEKEVISANAITGAYIFKNIEIFESAALEYLKSCEYEEFFMSGVFNILIKNKKIVHFPTELHLSFGTPTEYDMIKSNKLISFFR